MYCKIFQQFTFTIYLKLIRIVTAFLVVILFSSPQAVNVNADSDFSKIRFLLFSQFSQPNYYQELFYNNTLSIRGSFFQRNILTVFLVHGFSAGHTAFDDVKYAYLKYGIKANLILVDWSAISDPGVPDNVLLLLPHVFSYFSVVNQVEDVGHRIGDMILFLSDSGAVNINQVHIVGHSLGSHVSGNAGKRVKALRNVMIHRITGLDPAGPLFQPAYFAKHINNQDATIVDIIHTDARNAGDASTDGDLDFWPNGGHNQPGCPRLFTGASCNHVFAIVLYAASVSQPFTGCACRGFNILDSNQLSLDSKCLDPCQNATYLGPFLNTNVRGQYYLTTPLLQKPKPHLPHHGQPLKLF